ncbi:MAG: hypothetical protein C4320_04740, partial [Armatimonadota bacterium]
MRVTQRDIANMAGVSQATVSRVIAGDDRVEDAIASRVSRAIREHNYRPDVRARALRSRRTGLIGLVVLRPVGGLGDDPYWASLISAIVDHLAGTPYHLCVDMATTPEDHSALYDEMLRTRRVDGLLLVESEARDRRIARLLQDQFPFVLLGNPSGIEGAEGVPSVDNDNVEAARMATRHLFDNGFQRVGFLGARKGVTVGEDRIEGFLSAGGHRSLVRHADFGAEAASLVAAEWLTEPDRPDALVVLDDFMALGVVIAARRLGIQVPEDLGLVGFNDTSVCRLLEGGLTSVNLGLQEMIAQACNRLLGDLDGVDEHGPLRQIIPARLA